MKQGKALLESIGFGLNLNSPSQLPEPDQLELACDDFGGKAKFWSNAYKARWSKFDSDTYENVIQEIRESLNGGPMWKIEDFWKGHH